MPAFTPGRNLMPPTSSGAEKLPETLLSAADRVLDHLIRPA
jgi:hypothetical protein